MTFQEILDLAVYQSGSMGSDEGINDLENDAQTMIRQYVNEAYRIITRDYYRPYNLEEITLDENGGFNPESLSETLNEVLSVSRTRASLESGYGSRAIYDPLDIAYNPLSSNYVGSPGETVWIKYSYYFPSLDDLNAIPQIPDAYHALLADYATWRYMSTGNQDKQARAQFFYARWLDETSKVKRYGERAWDSNRFRNLWTR